MNYPCFLTALGAYTPAHRLTNAELCGMVDTSDEWIMSRTGIACRRRMAGEETTSSMGLEAAKTALGRSGLDAGQITHLIVGTCTPDYSCPSTASLIAAELGIASGMVFDFNAACSGYLYGLSLCRGLLATTPGANILLICVESMTRRINWADRTTCVLFGDGASACVLSAEAEQPLAGVRDVLCDSDSSLNGLIRIGGGTAEPLHIGDTLDERFFLRMQGQEVFKHAVRRMAEICRNLLERNGLTIDDVDMFVPHQANMRIIGAVGARLGIPEEKVFTNVAEYGNTSAASVPLALTEALEKNILKPGTRTLCTSFGAGLTWSAALLDF